MDSKPLVSIALCTYNGERFLKEQLDSIVGQTYSNIELITVDDCSTDNTLKILQEYAERYPFIKIYLNPTNLGYIKNFEKALRLCKGAFIALSDQDDIWQKNKIEKQVEAIGDNILIYHDSKFIDYQGNPLNKNMSDVMNFYRGDQPEAFLFFNCISGHSVLLKRELLDYLLPFPDTYFHDWWMGFVATNQGRIDYLNDTLVHYRQHENTDTNILKRDQKKRKKVPLSPSELYKRKLEWLKSCAEYSFNEHSEFIKAIYKEYIENNNTYFSFGITKILYLNRSLLLKISNKNNFSKLNFILKEGWGGKMRKLFRC